MNSKDLRILITKYKEANQMSNYDVGLEIGISQNTVRRFISGEDILPSTLEKIEKFFTRDCEEKTELEKLKEENALLKEQLLKKSETEQALQVTIEAIQDANKRISQCTEAIRQINEIIKHYHLKVGGEVIGAETIYKIENKIKEILK